PSHTNRKKQKREEKRPLCHSQTTYTSSITHTTPIPTSPFLCRPDAYRCGTTGVGGIFLICLIRNSLSSINCSSSVRSSKKCDRKCSSFSLFINKIFCTGTL